MINTVNQACPLCDEAAEYYEVDYGNRKYFKCPNCTLFQISRRAEEILREGDRQWRQEYAQMASRAAEGERLVIVVGRQPPGNGAKSEVSGEYVAAGELPG